MTCKKTWLVLLVTYYPIILSCHEGNYIQNFLTDTVFAARIGAGMFTMK